MPPKHIHRIYGILLSCLLAITGILLIVSCIGIYRSAPAAPFTAQKVAAAFSKIALPAYLSLAGIVGGIVLDIAFPTEKKKLSVEKQYPLILERLQKKQDLCSGTDTVRAAIQKQQRTRKYLLLSEIALLLICTVVFLFYGLNTNNFPEGKATESVVQSMGWFIPCTVIPFAWAVTVHYLCQKSIRAEIDLWKQLPGKKTAEAAPSRETKTVPMGYIQLAVCLVAVVLVVYACLTGGTEEIFEKAVAICKECIGLG